MEASQFDTKWPNIELCLSVTKTFGNKVELDKHKQHYNVQKLYKYYMGNALDYSRQCTA